MDRIANEQHILDEQTRAPQRVTAALSRFQVNKPGTPNSERAYWCEQIAGLVGKPIKQIIGLTRHLPTDWIRQIYEQARTGKNPAALFWHLLKQSRQ
jgi:hypothetical protein